MGNFWIHIIWRNDKCSELFSSPPPEQPEYTPNFLINRYQSSSFGSKDDPSKKLILTEHIEPSDEKDCLTFMLSIQPGHAG
jgi:hypothetical protein